MYLLLSTGQPRAWGTARAAWYGGTSGRLDRIDSRKCSKFKEMMHRTVVSLIYWKLYMCTILCNLKRMWRTLQSLISLFFRSHWLILFLSLRAPPPCGRAQRDEPACLDWKVIRWSKYLYYCSVICVQCLNSTARTNLAVGVIQEMILMHDKAAW